MSNEIPDVHCSGQGSSARVTLVCTGASLTGRGGGVGGARWCGQQGTWSTAGTGPGTGWRAGARSGGATRAPSTGDISIVELSTGLCKFVEIKNLC